jgi:anti-sigma B factor antagonist
VQNAHILEYVSVSLLRDIALGLRMASSKLDIQERDVDDVTVMTLTGQITLDDGDLLFRRHVHALLDRGRTKILADLAGVTVIDSSGVGMMAAKLKTVRDLGGDLKLLRLTNRNQHLLGLLKLKTVFDVHEDEAAALKSFTWKR